jgi:endonuclease YncB( thermonuclease family)
MRKIKKIRLNISRSLSRSIVKSLLIVFFGSFGYWIFAQKKHYTAIVKKFGVEIEYEVNDFEPSNSAKKLLNKSTLENSFSGYGYAIDGDSLKIAGNEVRLLEIDAPEYQQTCFDTNNLEYNCGQIAKKYTQNLIKNKQVDCYYFTTDMYKRYLAKCFIGELEINKELIRSGMAIIYSYNQASEEMIELEQQAKTAKIGIWQGIFQNPKDYRRFHKNNHKKHNKTH